MTFFSHILSKGTTFESNFAQLECLVFLDEDAGVDRVTFCHNLFVLGLFVFVNPATHTVKI
jgi:hypothetical protein